MTGFKPTKQNLTSLGILTIVLAVGAYLIFSGDGPLWPKRPEKTPEFVPLIDIALEKIDNPTTFRLTEPKIVARGKYSAALADVFVPYDVDHDGLVAATKNALIKLYESQDPAIVRWYEVNVYLEVVPPRDPFQAATGILNTDQQGFDGHKIPHPWQVTVRLLDAAARQKLGIDDVKLGRILSAIKTIEEIRGDLTRERGAEPTEDEALIATAKRLKMSKKMLLDFQKQHEKLYGQTQVLDWDLK